jgi:8-hydroxy-5-deazaflavin:NADPH oxidoreductase
MTIGIIGAGGIGQALAYQMTKAGYEVVLSNSRGPDSLADVVKRLGPRATAGTRQDAAQAEVVAVAVQWQHVPAALADLPPWKGRILIDSTNPVIDPGFKLAELNGRTSSEVVASLAPGARVVKVGNTLQRALLASDPNQAGGHRVLFMSGDDSPAKSEVSRIFEKAGFATLDLGGMAIGGRLQQFPGGPLPNQNLIKLG